MSNEFRESFRAMLLPISVDRERQALVSVDRFLHELAVAQVDRATWLKIEHESWLESNTAPNQNFRNLVLAGLQAGDEEYGPQLAREYFAMHSMLKEHFLFSPAEASAFLSHSILIARLSSPRQRMSSAQIAKLLAQRDTRVGFSRQSVEKVIARLRTKREFERSDVQRVFEEDAELEESLLADADLASAADAVGEIARKLGLSQDIGNALITLASEDEIDRHSPYIQMLHYQCTIAEFFDHSLTDIYEFKPRGERVTWLTAQYPDALVKANNPFLNNAKSVEKISMSWARSKQRLQYPGACALVEILTALEFLGFAARRELASWIRLWIHRVMRYARPLASRLPSNGLTQRQLDALLDSIALQETSTAGIIEQRLVDALSSVAYPRDTGWISRGLGDAVNATNVSRRKIGDCDFQNPVARRAVAFEAHGGLLTEVYLRGHLQTLAKALIPRQKEWSGFSDPSEWSVEIQFIAHEIAAHVPNPINVGGTEVSFRLMTYEEFIQVSRANDLVAATKAWIVDPLNQKRTPTRVRQKLLELTVGRPEDE